MTSPRDQIKAALSQALLGVLVKNRSASLDLLFELLDEIRAEGGQPLPVPEAVKAAAKGTTTTPRKTSTPKKAAQQVPTLPNLREASGRDAFDVMVYAGIQSINGGVDVPARALTGKVPGDPDQRLNALKRLAAAGRISVSGERAATRYSVVGAAGARTTEN